MVSVIHMNWEIYFAIALLLFTLVALGLEKLSSDLVSITIIAVILLVSMVSGSSLLPSVREVMGVFSNSAPITIACMFVIGVALERCGVIEDVSKRFTRLVNLPFPLFLFLFVIVVSGISAFLNNTAVVIFLVPVILNLAKKMNIASSKLLIPLSYAAVFGGCCTLIGTSTNILVSGVMERNGIPGFSMFELIWVGGPMVIIGAVYLGIFANRLLPVRESLSSILTEAERKEYIMEGIITQESRWIGLALEKTPLMKTLGVRVLEINRNGQVMPLVDLVLEAGDRFMLSCRASGVANAHGVGGLDFALLDKEGRNFEAISKQEAFIVEGIVGAKSDLIGRSLRDIDFKRKYRAQLIAVHRRGVNMRENLANIEFQFGDMLLLMGTTTVINQLRETEAIILLDKQSLPTKNAQKKKPIVLMVLLAIIVFASFSNVPIVGAAIIGVVVLLLTGCVHIKECYKNIEWGILVLIFGMLTVGLVMEKSGFVELASNYFVGLVSGFIPEGSQPMALFVCIYLLSMLLTEVLSNNAVAVIMTPIAIGFALTLGVDPRPYVVATCIASSAAFATPIGYQTNTYVYGIGGYRFMDFVRIGLPLNVLYFVGAVLIIPRVWAF